LGEEEKEQTEGKKENGREKRSFKETDGSSRVATVNCDVGGCVDFKW